MKLGYKSGLIVTGKTDADNKLIWNWMPNSDYYADFYAEHGCYVFPEEKDRYDALEKELSDLFNDMGIDAGFEGIWS